MNTLIPPRYYLFERIYLNEDLKDSILKTKGEFRLQFKKKDSFRIYRKTVQTIPIN